MISFWTAILILTSGDVLSYDFKKPMTGEQCLSHVGKEFGETKEVAAYGCIRKTGREV